MFKGIDYCPKCLKSELEVQVEERKGAQFDVRFVECKLCNFKWSEYVDKEKK